MNPPIIDHDASVREAFSRQAPVFDELDAGNPLIAWIRGRVQEEALRYMRTGSTLLELNAGTGIDSFHFAGKGIHVTATDNAPGMLDQLRERQLRHPRSTVEVIACSFLELDRLGDRRFDHVFSNFGGINCTPNLDRVLRGIDRVLLPCGTCTLVIMPHVSPWELVEALRGHFKMAFRRIGNQGALAQVEGVPFRCWYHSSKAVRHNLPGYEVLRLMALSFFVPPPHLMPFAARHPRLVRLAEKLEERTCRWPVIRSWGDHYLITLRKPAS